MPNSARRRECTKRNFSRNSTAFLEILEEIARAGHKIDYAYYRKKVLDKTNDSKREILTLIDKLNI